MFTEFLYRSKRKSMPIDKNTQSAYNIAINQYQGAAEWTNLLIRIFWKTER